VCVGLWLLVHKPAQETTKTLPPMWPISEQALDSSGLFSHLPEYSECVSRDLYVIICPNKGQFDHQQVFWGDLENPDEVAKLHVYNNCQRARTLRAFGENVPDELASGTILQKNERVAFVLPEGFDGSVFGQVGCDSEMCDVCACPGACSMPPFACSTVDVQVQGGSIRYRINDSKAFTTAYLVTPGKEDCAAAGGHMYLNTQQMLRHCPVELTFQNDGGVVNACLSPCRACTLEKLVSRCRCVVDSDCKRCPAYVDRSIADSDNEPPLRCVNSRCKSNVGMFDGNTCDADAGAGFTFGETHCCQPKAACA